MKAVTFGIDYLDSGGFSSTLPSGRLLRRRTPYLWFDKQVQIFQSGAQDFHGLKIEDYEPTYSPSSHRRALAFLPGGLGDLVCFTAVAKAIKQQLGKSVWVASYPQCRSIMELCPYIEGFLRYPVKKSIADEFDVLTMESLLEIDASSSMTEAMAKEACVELESRRPILEPRPIDYELAWAQIPQDDRPKVGIQVKASTQCKSYPLVHVGYLATLLADRGYAVYLTGEYGDFVGWYRRLEDGTKEPIQPPPHVYNVCGAFEELSHFVAFVGMLDAMVSPDSFAMHVAEAVSTPCLALFGPTRYEERLKTYRYCKPLRTDSDCTCDARSNEGKCGKTICPLLGDLHPEGVADELERML